jgi:hypothetical protein
MSLIMAGQLGEEEEVRGDVDCVSFESGGEGLV